MSETQHPIYSKATIEFVTVGVEFCAMLENDTPVSRKEWLAKITRLLPMLYLKASLLPEVFGMDENDVPETFVGEEDYARIAGKISAVMGDEDVYLDTFVEDMKYSDTPVSAFISENIADIYQDIRDFVSVYQYEMEDQMYAALVSVLENFKIYWGQKLVNVLRPLHALLYLGAENDEYSVDNVSEKEF